jgi:hypothetical protein
MFGKKPDDEVVKLSPRALKSLDELMELSGSETRPECLRNAMRLFSMSIRWAKAGNTFAIVTPEGSVVPVDIFVDHSAIGKPKLTVIDGGKGEE